MHAFLTPIAEQVWRTKYRQRDASAVWDASIGDTWRRVARALSQVEREPKLWEQRFLDILQDLRFLPGGRILAGAGTAKPVTLFNCFVMGTIEDTLPGVFRALEQGALTMQAGGGVGYDFSTLHPAGRDAVSGAAVPGPVAFMHVWQSVCAALTATTERRGAMMATLRCDHPDIETFVDAKRDPAVLRHFNLSVLVTDAFMRAVNDDLAWPLVFGGAGVQQHYRTLPARALWQRIMQAAYDSAEPGVIFIDQVNRCNNLAYCESICATNPCGEIPLPPYGACDLGSLNLTRFVLQPFSAAARLDFTGIEQTVPVAVRMLDNVYEVSSFPLPRQAEVARASRRLGIGITGLADVLAMLGLRYDTAAARALAAEAMRAICHAAYRTSTELAREKGAFPSYAAQQFSQRAFIQQLPQALRAAIAREGMRNSHLLAIAPAGSISLLANNVSSGLEPIFDLHYGRRVSLAGGETSIELEDFAYRMFREQFGQQALPHAFMTTAQVTPQAQLEMQAALQRYVDNAISKTVTTPADVSFEDFAGLYHQAYELGLKGCTVFRPNSRRGAVLTTARCNNTLEEACGIDQQLT